MYKSVQAYFRNENDAEDVHAKLKRLNPHNVFVDFIEEDVEGMNLIVPPARDYTNMNLNMFGANEIRGFTSEEGNNVDDHKVILTCEIDEKQLPEALEIFSQEGAYIDKSLIE